MKCINIPKVEIKFERFSFGQQRKWISFDAYGKCQDYNKIKNLYKTLNPVISQFTKSPFH